MGSASTNSRSQRLGRSCWVDRVLSELGQDHVRVLLLDQGLLKQLLGFRQAELLGPRQQGSVAGDLVVLDGLSRGDQTGI